MKRGYENFVKRVNDAAESWYNSLKTAQGNVNGPRLNVLLTAQGATRAFREGDRIAARGLLRKLERREW